MQSTPTSSNTDTSAPVSTQSLAVHSSGTLRTRDGGVQLKTEAETIAPPTDTDDAFFNQFLGKEPSDGRTAPSAQGAPANRQGGAAPKPDASPLGAASDHAPSVQPATPEEPFLLNLDGDEQSYEDENGQRVVPAAQSVEPVKPAQPAQPAAPVPPGKRNIEGLPPDIAKVAGQMSNAAWARLEPLLREHGAMQKERYADHPDGYTLAPEYKEMLSTYSGIKQEIDFAQQQLAQARRGESFYILDIGEDGKPQQRGPFEATSDSLAQLEALIADGQQGLRSIQTEAVAFKDRFANAHKQVDERIALILKPVFEPYGEALGKKIDAKLAEHKLPKYLAQRQDLRNTTGLLLLFQSATKEIARLNAVVQANGGAPRRGGGGGRAQQGDPKAPKAITKQDDEFFDKHLPKPV